MSVNVSQCQSMLDMDIFYDCVGKTGGFVLNFCRFKNKDKWNNDIKNGINMYDIKLQRIN